MSDVRELIADARKWQELFTAPIHRNIVKRLADALEATLQPDADEPEWMKRNRRERDEYIASMPRVTQNPETVEGDERGDLFEVIHDSIPELGIPFAGLDGVYGEVASSIRDAVLAAGFRRRATVDVDALADVIVAASNEHTVMVDMYNPERADAGWPPPSWEYFLARAVVEWMEKQ